MREDHGGHGQRRRVQRPGLERVHNALRSGDVLAVWRLDRLGLSLEHLIELMAELEAERIRFRSVTEPPTIVWLSHLGVLQGPVRPRELFPGPAV